MEPVLRLERFTAAHLPEFAVLARDPDVLRFTRFPDPPQDAFPAHWLARYEAGRRDGTKEAFAILDAAGGTELLGVALAVEVDRAAGAAELGYLTGPAARGRGIATEALRQLTRWARDDEGLQTLTLVIDAENAGSRKVAERAGYALVRVDRDAELKPGRRGDLVVYELPADAASDASGAPQASRSSGGGTL